MDWRWSWVDVEVHIDVHIYTSLLKIFSFSLAHIFSSPDGSKMAGCSSFGKGGVVVVAWKRSRSCVNCF